MVVIKYFEEKIGMVTEKKREKLCAAAADARGMGAVRLVAAADVDMQWCVILADIAAEVLPHEVSVDTDIGTRVRDALIIAGNRALHTSVDALIAVTAGILRTLVII